MNMFKKAVKEAKELDAALTEVYRAPEPMNSTPSKSIYALNLYITLDDLNDYIRNKVDERFKDATFIPFDVKCNSNDFSIEMTLLSSDVLDDCDMSSRYRLDLDKMRKEN